MWRIFLPAPAQSAPAIPSKISNPPNWAARTAPSPARRSCKLAIDKTRSVLGVPADYLIGIVAASDTGAFEMAMWSMLGARGVDVLAWESFGKDWVTDIVKQLKLPGARVLRSALRRASRSYQGRFQQRRRLHLERHDIRRPRSRRGLDPRRPRGPDLLRRHLRRLRARPRLGEARCRHLLLAEGARRRSAARHAHPVAARGRAARKLYAVLADAEAFPHDQGRQAEPRDLRRLDHQHAVHALRRRLSRRAALGEGPRRLEGVGTRARTPISR